MQVPNEKIFSARGVKCIWTNPDVSWYDKRVDLRLFYEKPAKTDEI